jgi:hypothetical protein
MKDYTNTREFKAISFGMNENSLQNYGIAFNIVMNQHLEDVYYYNVWAVVLRFLSDKFTFDKNNVNKIYDICQSYELLLKSNKNSFSKDSELELTKFLCNNIQF